MFPVSAFQTVNYSLIKWLHVAGGVGWQMQRMDLLHCETLMGVCKTLTKEQQNVSVFAGHLLQAEQPLSKYFSSHPCILRCLVVTRVVLHAFHAIWLFKLARNQRPKFFTSICIATQ
jgi:hypothetical protein